MINNSFVKSFIKNITGFSIGTWGNFALGILIIPITTRVFSPNDLGSINLFITYYTFFTYFCYLGLDQSFVRFFHEVSLEEERKYLFGYCLKYSLAISGFIFVLIYLFKNHLSSEILGRPTFVVGIFIGISLVGQVILRYFNLLYRMRLNIKMFTIQSLLIGIGLKVAYVFAGIIKDNEDKVIAAIITISVYNFLWALFFFLKEKKNIFFQGKIKKKMKKEIFYYGLPLVPITVVSWMNTSLPQLLLNKYADFYSVGVYTNAMNLAAMVSIVKEGFANYWTPFVFENYKTAKDKLEKIHHNITLLTILAGFSLMMVTDIIYLFIDKRYHSGKSVFSILLISPILLTILNVTDSVGISIAKKNHLQLVAYIISALVNIGCSLVLLPLYGIVGGAVASALSSFSLLVSMTVFGRKYYSFITDYRKMALGIILLIVAITINSLFINRYLLRYSLLICLVSALCIVYRNECLQIREFIKKEHKSRKK